MKKIIIIDYDCGNILSLQRAIEKIGYKSEVSRDKKIISSASHVILPGVGAFGNAMSLLNKYKLIEPIKEHVQKKKPLLGICLGMQLLLSESSEFGKFSGLDLIKGKVENILNQTQKKIKVPHIGWNKIFFNGKSEYNIANDKNFYFIHSFISKTKKNNSTIAFTDYNGIKIPAIIKEENIIGFQFHPEKSHYTGLELIKIFLT